MISLSAVRPRSDLVSKAREIAREVAAKHAVDVDTKARFPSEAFAALRQAKLLSAAVPKELGGGGCNLFELASMCMELAQGCSATGMVLAMHHIQVACIARHGLGNPFFRQYLKDVIERQLLIASITSEVGVWGDMRSSICGLERDGDKCKLTKDASTVSYGEIADDFLVTCRRTSDAPQNDQVLVLLRKGDYQLTKNGNWDTLGMRGTCSPPFKISATFPATQVLPSPFGDSSAQTMVSYSHVLWSGVWTGIAADAVSRAAACVRAEARKKPGSVPPHATRLAEVMALLQTMRNNTVAVANEVDEVAQSEGGMETLLTIGWALKMNNIKAATSEMAPQVVHHALQVIGISGYKNDHKFSVGRHYRDVLSAALMISNDRIFAKSASMLLVYKDE